jgi:hypothetical protein
MLSATRSTVRFFSADKTVPSPIMNRLGAQVARTLLARMMHSMRATRAQIAPIVSDHIKTLERDGIVVIPNFLPTETIDDLRRRAEAIWEQDHASAKVFHHGPNTFNVLTNEIRPSLPAEMHEFFGDPRVPAMLEAAERRPGRFAKHGYMNIERLCQLGPIEMEDQETQLHSDIFFTSHKGWLYLTDVTPECGPFVYVKGSHRLSPKMLSYVYRESCGRNKGSRRISQQELDDLHLEETVLTCPRGTFVVGNTFGFHRRLRGKPGHERLALHAGMRSNPFFARD